MPEKIVEKPESGLSEEEVQFYRNAAEITLARVGQYKEFDAPAEEERSEKFREAARKTWQFAVHGGKEWINEKNERHVQEYADLDGKCALGLFNLAGFDIKEKGKEQNVVYVPKGEYVEGRVNLDTGGRHGIVVSGEGEGKGTTAFIDHHADDSDNKTSTTAIVYKMLSYFGFFDEKSDREKNGLKRLAHYVTVIDNKNYLDDRRYDNYFKHYFQNSWSTTLGLQRFINFKYAGDFFKGNTDSTEVIDFSKLSSEKLVKYGLLSESWQKKDRQSPSVRIVKNRVEEQEKRVKDSEAALQKLAQEKLIIDSDKYGKIAVDIGQTVTEGIDAARAFGCEAYISWSPDKDRFFINTVKPLEEEFSQGKKIRGHMWLKPNEEREPITLRLGEVLAKMTDGKFEAQGVLKEFLEREAKGELVTVKGAAPDNLPTEAPEELEASVARGRQLMEQLGIKTMAQKRQMIKWLEKKLAGVEV